MAVPRRVREVSVAQQQVVQLLNLSEARHEHKDGASDVTELSRRVDELQYFQDEIHVDPIRIQPRYDVACF